VEEIASMAVQFLRDLIRFDTSNPPGNELPAAQYVAEVLRTEGIESTVLESAPSRGNIVARLAGNGSEGALLLMSHLDVVPAVAEEWEHPPFAADVADGYIWGRGAVDTKQLTAMQLATLVALKRANVALKRDVVLAATADEEVGGTSGMGWLVRNHTELLKCEYAINEGGGFGLTLGGKRLYVCQTGEKGVCWMRLTAHGHPGHGSIPHADNAVCKLSAALSRLGKARLPQHRTATVDRLVRSFAATQSFPASLMLPLVLNPLLEPRILRQMEGKGPLAAALAASLHNTVSPTVVHAGQKTNVIPSHATAEVDGRLVPGQTPEDLLREIQPFLGEGITVEILQQSKAYESEPDSPLYDVFQQVLDRHDPGCEVIPFLIPGATDARYLAERGVKAYGFSPAKQEPGWPLLEMAHAPNERISLANIEFGTGVLHDVVRTFCAK
jgi:acetylornithine deacetylase/succinyl-diaminopimelate desuccinylase-like protein